MARDPRYDILFEPIKIGPVTAKNRFYQVPHCNGMGHPNPRAVAGMRGMKAEGGWAVICTEECEIHPTGDVSPYKEARLWDDHDIPGLAMMCDAVHEHGALAGCELVHNGPSCPNHYSRELPIGPSHQPVNSYDPMQARAMDREDIRNYRRWHRDAAIRAKRAGFDVIYVYAGHDLSLPMHFLQRRRNNRTDEYGGSLENRVRLFRELIEETKDAIGDRCAVVVRYATDELIGPEGLTLEESQDIVGMLAELPDLWDVNVSAWQNDSTTSRFKPEGNQEPFIAFVKKMTSKPVVGVGRFTSPDTMVSQIRRGVLDMIGAARPSIADPFLPKKIEEGRPDDIRECIGCNICVSGDFTMSHFRCTQNPTMGEEWRKGWHPEIVPVRKSEDEILVVGAGPAGLECARTLGQRGYRVHLAEASAELGGRVAKETKLPGLSEWGRVRDYRAYQLGKLLNVEIYRGSRLDAAHVLEMGASRVVIATGADWRRDGIGRMHGFAVPGFETANVFTPDDVMAGKTIAGPVIVYDDDHYYMGGVIAEKLRRDGLEVAIVTPADLVSSWTQKTLEASHIQRRLLELGIELVVKQDVTAFKGDHVELACVYTGRRTQRACASLVTVTARLPRLDLYDKLMAQPGALIEAGIKSVTAIGDARSPGTIAAAVYQGHRYARELDEPPTGEVAFKREMPGLAV
ncbi:MAG TPA: FAD-dependent oxidoreductase [Hypericibacter adhaerens]|uniref:oxidoreductase n=1 Tax=Hypericibacter adhaerens TaxID=2602016 RepID=UPI002B71A28A|nr:FAD-dependent oxidoreductase [Hypericibacter adhaerens]HWA43503.1 FAD-dependent oxidoreductase [Hypericibacter adhaerens]